MIHRLEHPGTPNPLVLLPIAIVVVLSLWIGATVGAGALRQAGIAHGVDESRPAATLANVIAADRAVRNLRLALTEAVASDGGVTVSHGAEHMEQMLSDAVHALQAIASSELNAGGDGTVPRPITADNVAGETAGYLLASLRSGNIDAARRIYLERTRGMLAAHEIRLQAMMNAEQTRVAVAYRQAQSDACYAYLFLGGFVVLMMFVAAIAVSRIRREQLISETTTLPAQTVSAATPLAEAGGQDSRRLVSNGDFHALSETLEAVVEQFGGHARRLTCLAVAATDAPPHVVLRLHEQGELAQEAAAVAAGIRTDVGLLAEQAAAAASAALKPSADGPDDSSSGCQCPHDISRVSQAVSQSGQIVHLLNLKSEQLSDIVKQINDIADGNNRLALNRALDVQSSASPEAAPYDMRSHCL